jgi:26 proteasome complex subunit DSS1
MDKTQEPKQETKQTSKLEEDDEFEDFPVEGKALLSPCSSPDWADADTDLGLGPGGKEHLWQESWDDEDLTDTFSNQLK